MSADEIVKACVTRLNFATKLGEAPWDETLVTLVTPKGWKPPPKFPRGKLLMINPDTQDRVWHFNALRVLAWLTANGFVKVRPAELPPGETNEASPPTV